MGSDYWKGMLDWLKGSMLAQGMISEEDLDFLHIADEPEDAVRHIQKFVIV